MISRFLLLMALSCCVCGTLVVNVAHTSYQAEENQTVTLEWTFTPKPDRSTHRLHTLCHMFTVSKNLVLFHLRGGVEVPESQDEEFSGRVQFDKDVLREGRIRLHVSSLRTEDSGEYTCWVKIFHEEKWDRCQLNVTAARNLTVSKTGTERLKPQSQGSIILYCGLGLFGFCIFLVIFILLKKKLSISGSETDSLSSAKSGPLLPQ